MNLKPIPYFKNQIYDYEMIKRFPIGEDYQFSVQLFDKFVNHPIQADSEDVFFSIRWMMYRNHYRAMHSLWGEISEH